MKKLFIITIALLTLPLPANEWGIETMPVEEIKPGMIGTASTVFYGDDIEEFGVEVLDVMYNFYPKLDVILVKLLGEKAEKTGVVSGMSGSPVYIDGKLIGALSFRFGQFMKEPIGGVMPIKYMLEIEGKNQNRIKVSRQTPFLQDYIEAALVGVDENFWATVLNMPERIEPTTSDLSIISSPLIFSGFQPEMIRQYNPYFNSLGFTPMASGNTGPVAKKPEPLKPGSAVSISFLTGDLGIEATGTVTAVGDNKLLAFGHQLFNFGPIHLPLAGTRIYTTLPSMMGSSKMAASTGILGTFVQDRLSGAFGDLNMQPSMIPIHLKIESPFHDPIDFNFKLANDPAFNNMLPFYLRTALIQASYTARLAGEQNSSHLTGSITLSDGRSLEFDDLFTSQQIFGFLASGSDAVSATDLVTTVLGNLMVNDFDSPEIASVDVNLQTIPGSNYAVIESVWQDKTKVKAGESITLAITLRDNHGVRHQIDRVIRIPKNVDGQRLSIFVASGSSLSRYEVQVARDKFVPNNFDDLYRILSERRKTQNLYIHVRAMDSGIIVDGQEMLGVPPSVMNVMSTRSSGGVMQRLRDRMVHEEQVSTGNVIVGAKRLLLSVESPSKATTQNGHGNKAWYQ